MQHRLAHPKPATRAHDARGMTLMEVLVAMFIFVISVLGYSKLQSGLFHQGMDNRQRSIAIWKAEELIDLVSANNSSSALTQYADVVSDPDVCLVERPKTVLKLLMRKLHLRVPPGNWCNTMSGTPCVPRMQDRLSACWILQLNLSATMFAGMLRG